MSSNASSERAKVPRTMSVTEHFIVYEADTLKRRECKLKMRRGLKRIRSTKLAMACGVCFLLSVAMCFWILNVSDEIEQFPYGGESSAGNYAYDDI